MGSSTIDRPSFFVAWQVVWKSYLYQWNCFIFRIDSKLFVIFSRVFNYFEFFFKEVSKSCQKIFLFEIFKCDISLSESWFAIDYRLGTMFLYEKHKTWEKSLFFQLFSRLVHGIFLRCIRGRRDSLLRPILGRRVFLPSSFYGFCPWQHRAGL